MTDSSRIPLKARKNKSFRSIIQGNQTVESGGHDFYRPASSTIIINAEEIRQFIYCKRIPYWRRVVGITGQKTKLMDYGETYHEKVRKYNYTQKGDIDSIRDRYFFHKKKQFGARIDILRVLEDEIIPVEIKRFFHDKELQSLGHIAQGIVGGLAAEYELGKEMNSIEIKYFRGIRTLIDITEKQKNTVLKLIEELRFIISEEKLPPPTRHTKKCDVCEYWKICKRV